MVWCAKSFSCQTQPRFCQVQVELICGWDFDNFSTFSLCAVLILASPGTASSKMCFPCFINHSNVQLDCGDCFLRWKSTTTLCSVSFGKFLDHSQNVGLSSYRMQGQHQKKLNSKISKPKFIILKFCIIFPLICYVRSFCYRLGFLQKHNLNNLPKKLRQLIFCSNKHKIINRKEKAYRSYEKVSDNMGYS